MNHVTSWMIKRASFDTTPFNRSKTKTVKMTKDEVMNEKKKRGGEMSNENQETIADIVREMRTLGRLDEKSTDKIPRSLQALGLRTYADRIEAAHRREREEKSSQIGNAAAMRDALEQAQRVLHCAIVADILKGEDAHEALNAVSAALSAPPRNCDVGTAEEQLKRFNKFCFPIKCSECQLHTDEDLHDCIFRWSQMPYESEVTK